jgi:hypothetical protein
MKTDFKLDCHRADLIESEISIVGKAPEHKPYVRIEIGPAAHSSVRGQCLFIFDKDLERFAVNILKALKSKKLK